MRYAFALIVGCLTFAPGSLSKAAEANNKKEAKRDAKAIEFFETSVRPLLSAACFDCHSGKSDALKGGLRVDSREGLLKGGEHGPAIVPGKPNKSSLIRAISSDRGTKGHMPPKNVLEAEQVKSIEKWISMGAPWPEEKSIEELAKKDPKWGETSAKYEQIRKEHWSFQPVKDVQRPK